MPEKFGEYLSFSQNGFASIRISIVWQCGIEKILLRVVAYFILVISFTSLELLRKAE